VSVTEVQTPAPTTTSTTQMSEQTQVAYASLLAWEIHLRNTRKYSRVKETARLSRGECERSIEVTMRLPTLEDSGLAGSRLGMTNAEDLVPSELIVPVWPMRKGQLLGDFQVGSKTARVRILSRRRGAQITRSLLLQEWLSIKSALEPILARDPNVISQDTLARLSSEADRLLSTIVLSDPQESRKASIDLVNMLKRDLEPLLGQDLDRLPIDRLVAAAKFMGRRHIIWMATDARPGDVLEFWYQYTHRYSPEYSTHTSHRYPTYSTLKRFIGQTPSSYALAVSRFALARSYHFYTSAPKGCFFIEYGFADMKDKKLDFKAFQERAASAGADLAGRDETGGPTAHLYLYEMPLQPAHVHVFVASTIMEIPPGSVAPTSMVATASATLAALALWRWSDITPHGLQPAIWGALAVVATLTGGWYSSVFADRTRTTAPMTTKLGLIGAASFMTISLAYFGALALAISPEDRETLRVLFAVTVVSPLVAIFLAVWTQRIWNYRAYRRRQLSAVARYGLQPSRSQRG